MTDTTTGDLAHDASTNNPPKTLEGQIRERHAEFLKDAQAWIDSVARIPEIIENDTVYGGVGKTIAKLTEKAGTAKKLHTTEKEPFLRDGKLVDSIFLTQIIKVAEEKKDVLLARQKIWLKKKAAEETKKAEALAAEANRLAEEKRQETELALKAAERAQDSGDFEAANAALETAAASETAAQEAEQVAQTQEARAEGPVQDLVRQHHAVGVTTSAKSEKVTTYLGDPAKVDWAVVGPYIKAEEILRAAKAAVKAGREHIAGFTVESDIKPINR